MFTKRVGGELFQWLIGYENKNWKHCVSEKYLKVFEGLTEDYGKRESIVLGTSMRDNHNWSGKKLRYVYRRCERALLPRSDRRQQTPQAAGIAIELCGVHTQPVQTWVTCQETKRRKSTPKIIRKPLIPNTVGQRWLLCMGKLQMGRDDLYKYIVN